MPEVTIELKPIKMVYICDKCNKGQMIVTELEPKSDSPMILHQCSECGYIQLFNVVYPRVEYLPK